MRVYREGLRFNCQRLTLWRYLLLIRVDVMLLLSAPGLRHRVFGARSCEMALDDVWISTFCDSSMLWSRGNIYIKDMHSSNYLLAWMPWNGLDFNFLRPCVWATFHTTLSLARGGGKLATHGELAWWCSSSTGVKTIGLTINGYTWQWQYSTCYVLVEGILRSMLKRPLEGKNPKFLLQSLGLRKRRLYVVIFLGAFYFGEPFA